MTASWTKSRWSDVQTWPARRNPAVDAPRRRALQIGVVAHDGRRDAAELEGDRAEADGRCNSRPTAVLPVNEKKRMSWFSTSQRPTSAPGPCTSATWPRRQPGLEQQLEQQNGAERRRLRRLDDDGVARGERRRDLVATMFNGELNDVMPQTTPRGTRMVKARRCGVAGRVLDRHHLARQPLPFLGRQQQRLDRRG